MTALISNLEESISKVKELDELQSETFSNLKNESIEI